MFEPADEFSDQPLTAGQRTGFWRVSAVAAMVSLALPTFVVGIEVGQDVGGLQGSAVIYLGSLVIFVIAAVMGFIGAQTGLSSYLLVKVAFGPGGAAVVNLAFAISLVGWFGINVNLLGLAVDELAAAVFERSVPPWFTTMAATAAIIATTVLGFRAINTLSLLLAPVLVVVCGFLLVAALEADLESILTTGRQGALGMGDGISAIVGSIIVGAIIMPDITRFLHRPVEAIWVSALAFVLVQPLVMVIALTASYAMDTDDVVSLMVGAGLGVGALLIVIFGSWILNALNLYSAGLGFKATFPSLSSVGSLLAIGALGAVAGLLNVLEQFADFLFYLSVVFTPVAGIIVVDWWWVRPARYREDNTDAGQTSNACNGWGLITWGIGSIYAIAAAEAVVGSLTGAATLDAMCLSGCLYGIGEKCRNGGGQRADRY